MAWEDELGAELSDETWDRCLTAVRSCSVNIRHQLIQFKVIHRLHYTKTKLHKIFSFGFVLHCWDFGLAYLIGKAYRPLLLDAEEAYRPSLWV